MDGWAPHHLLGRVYEATRAASARRRGGVFYTPLPVAAGVARLALDGLGSALTDGAVVVLDPSVGAGALLLAAGEQLRVRLGVSAAAILAGLRGSDIDADAVAVARLALAWWCWTCDAAVSWPEAGALRVGDGLAAAQDGGPPGAAADLVIGNPPFLNQLGGATARMSQDRARAQARFGDAAKGYVDTATLFALAGLEAVRPGGRVVLIQPESMLVASHGAAARSSMAKRATLEGLWIGGARIFDAGVRVCAPVLRRNSGPDQPLSAVKLWRGVDFSASGRFDIDSPEHRTSLFVGSWASVLACARGVPDVAVASSGTLADIATATAGFRDQFYGLAPFVAEAASDPADTADTTHTNPQLVTCGLIDAGRSRWGRTSTRFAGRRWQHPTVDVAALAREDPTLARWVRARLRPKVLLATQAPVLKAVTDPDGAMVPSVPVISIEPRTADPTLFSSAPSIGTAWAGDGVGPHEAKLVWLIAAVLWCPVISVIAAQRHAGAGLSANALRLSARQVLDLPLPAHLDDWQSAAAAYRLAVTHALDAPNVGDATVAQRDPSSSELWRHAGTMMARAYGLDDSSADAAQRWWDEQARPSRSTGGRDQQAAAPA